MAFAGIPGIAGIHHPSESEIFVPERVQPLAVVGVALGAALCLFLGRAATVLLRRVPVVRAITCVRWSEKNGEHERDCRGFSDGKLPQKPATREQRPSLRCRNPTV